MTVRNNDCHSDRLNIQEDEKSPIPDKILDNSEAGRFSAGNV